MDGISLNGDETLVTANDPTPPHQRESRLSTKEVEVSPPRRKTPHETTDKFPSLPSQKAIDVAYLVNKCGRITAFCVIVAPAVLVMLPWVGTNVVIPVVNSLTKYIENQSEISKSLVVISQESVKVSALTLAQNKRIEIKLDQITNRMGIPEDGK
jgi:hypothetical protein